MFAQRHPAGVRLLATAIRREQWDGGSGLIASKLTPTGIRTAQVDRSTLHIPPGQVDAQIELQLVITGLHVLAQLVERLVVIALFEMREFVYHDHLQKLRRGVLEQRRHADFLLGLELATLHPGHAGVQAEGAMGEVQPVVEQHLVDVRRIAQVFLLEPQRVDVERLVTLHVVTARVALLQIGAQFVLDDQLPYLILQGRRIGLQIFERRYGSHGHGQIKSLKRRQSTASALIEQRIRGRQFDRLDETQRIVGGQRMSQQEPLNDLATIGHQPLVLLKGLYPFGNHVDVQHPTQVDDTARHRLVAGGAHHAADEMAIDLQGVQIEVSQVSQRTVTCPEIVERHPHTNVMQALQLLAAVDQVMDQ